MITRWLHFQELGSDPWVLPIYSAINVAVTEGRATALPDAVREKGLHITTRLNLLPRIVSRLRESLTELYAQARQQATADNEFTRQSDGVTLDIDGDVKYLAIADLHTFIFELDSCLDQMKVIMHQLHCHARQPLTDIQRIAIINEWMHARGIDPQCFHLLANCRNFIAHEGAFYLAIDITDDMNWDLLLVRANVVLFDRRKTYVRLSDVGRIFDGFNACKVALQDHLVALFSP